MEKLSVDFYIEKDLSTKLYENIREKKISFPQYIIELINLDLESEIKLSNDFYFNLKDLQIYSPEKKKVDLTNLESSLLLLLMKNKNKTSSIETIKLEVWKSDNVTLQSLRNLVRQIRRKTTYSLIETVASRGYVIKTY